jgi:hypothetical protein
MAKKKYAVVFDLDETLGHFSQPYKFWYHLKKFLNSEAIHEKYFFSFLDLFPEFLRTDIFKILKYVKKKKIAGTCNYVMIYTNNNGPNYWANIIMSYIHKKLNYELFDQIIRAFKVNGQFVEVCRTSHSKSYKDFLSCTKLSSNTKMCFVDDQYHPDMEHNNVWYIYVQPYTYNLEYDQIIGKYFKENAELFKQFNKTESDFINYMSKLSSDDLENLNKTTVEKNIDILISKKIENNIKKFLGEKTKYTRKNKKQTKNRTRRN